MSLTQSPLHNMQLTQPTLEVVEQADPPKETMTVEIKNYTARTAPGDVDTIEICPAYPDFMIFGTYNLVKPGEPRDYPSQVRKGLIEVIPVTHKLDSAYVGELPPKLATCNFWGAVTEVHFHPDDPTLLGVSLSNTKIHFFHLVKRGEVLGRRVITELLPLGYITAGERDEYDCIPLVTQFLWLPSIREAGRRDVDETVTVSMALTLSSKIAKIIKIRIPAIKSTDDPRLLQEAEELPILSEDINSHEEAAWNVASLPTFDFDGNFHHILFSGGDDSRLIASMVEQDTCSNLERLLMAPPTHLWSNRKMHGSGVTSILPLPRPQPIQTKDRPILPTPLLTGGYDENFNLHAIAPQTHRATPLASLEMRGGVWRMKLMDTYLVRIPTNDTIIPNILIPNNFQTHYLILVSNSHAGCKIIRLIHDSSPSASPPAPSRALFPTHAVSTDKEWTIKIEAFFRAGHSTLVYSSDFRKEWKLVNNPVGLVGQQTGGRLEGDIGMYTVVSTSFYDKQICVWNWRDVVRIGGKSNK